ncbi:MAG: hypothetical protein K0S32_2026 [Bacteroidetes bacterium]|jgi:hypothetical protein|nr:hypothetical protein [Bacteroidota bacterium]
MRLTLIFLLTSFFTFSQKDSLEFVPLIGIHVGGHLPGGNLKERFGPNLNAGGSFIMKTKKNWLFGVQSNYFFGKNVREDVLQQMRGADGNVIDNEGYPADIRVSERGLCVHLIGGKVFPFLSANRNSGILFMAGAGYMQHKINLFDAQQKIAAIKGDLRTGYDRLTNGFSSTQFLGYLFLSENRIANFYAGIETFQGFTTSVRKLNYDTGLPDTKPRVDLLYGFRIGWILPLYKKRPDDYYYN